MFPNQNYKKIARTPDVMGVAGKAWRVDLEAICRYNGIPVTEQGTVAAWVVEAPYAHMVWHSYAVILIHLRPNARCPKPVFHLAGATHEIWVKALNLGADREKWLQDADTQIIDGERYTVFLEPSNFASQFIETSDEAAAGRALEAVRRICNGSLSPDTDFIRAWMHLFGDNMIKDKARAGETRISLGDREIVIPPHPGPQDLN